MQNSEKLETNKNKSNTTIFTVRCTIGREKTVQDLMFNRFRTITPVPDIKSILISDKYRGFIFVEAIYKRDVTHLVRGLRHVKGKVIGSIPLESLDKIIRPEKAFNLIEEGDIVEIINGLFQNNKAQVLNISKEGTREEQITVKLLDSNNSITIKIPPDDLKLIEKKKKVTTQYRFVPTSASTRGKGKGKASAKGNEVGTNAGGLAASGQELEQYGNIKEGAKVPNDISQSSEVIITEEAVTDANLDETFSFDDGLDDEDFEEFIEDVNTSENKEPVEENEEDEDEDEDEEDWSKFMF
ncbi:MAG: transcription elongation factor Spt5 [Promethearchaeota archaeon]